MAAPDLEVVLEATNAVLMAERNRLDQLTQRKTRQLVEKRLDLEEGLLGSREFKDAIKTLVVDFVAAQQESPADAAHQSIGSSPPAKSAKSNAPDQDLAKKRKRKSSGANQDEQDKASLAMQRTQKDSTKRKRSSAAVDSDLDDKVDCAAVEPVTKKQKASSKGKPTPTEKAFEQFIGMVADEMKHDRLADMSDVTVEEEPQPPAGPSKIFEFDSDLSSVYDDGPAIKKKARKKGKSDEAVDLTAGKTKEKAAKTKREKKSGEVDTGEEEIKRLKSYVTACGVRKQWAKELKGLDRPSQQISHIKKVLAELGMTGRLSMEKAKAIRAKREFAQELEDVVEFEKKRGSRAREKGERLKSGQSVGSSDEDEEEVVKPAPKRNTLNDQLSAFLADQSDDD
ncbi:hypothetical protein BKA62DRAFT_766341 [Auriculariales sp. MPI-PUGE-AT-0066]|nr:hypothetical protein BKA62DRAFT_766341 [Auriculariales sp. MPI-PUGE-AT-0066]